ncbi:BFH_collapsed_G0046340.mRNA.1.CDS.1 [Saccharomyces cerevisiae]|nr:BFH_HP2_G0045220.mRNA.1.CDS.1 [Saccharomyces cerevisiae]CAI6735023.1 BFH_HP2_G0045220.mRNA.1.CDS.1 [Saccharomyces cerevisiae]CAI6747833.1 BFH_HP1_G0045640.mRNA.1.CDS.1 [Saccharomyces cerevisiae]CAI7309951.1 ASN_collapsed_G0046300.mRNA.1.CDS.1 [Saccharomyces cerevisiae]CAI7312898.1 BFH_collapsed_G0046340.mRNA.1.CDS.1 [Saccharomyces cerevisiae]
MAPTISKRIKTLSVSRPIIYGNTAKKMGSVKPPNAPAEHTHLWTIFVRGPQNEDISYFIKKVVFKLHDTYPNPVRSIEAPPFELTETGWGEFDINIKVYFVEEANEKVLNFYHRLRLHPYANPVPNSDNGNEQNTTDHNSKDAEVSSVYFDEIVFNEPNEEFFKILMSRPGNLLPSNKTDDCVYSKQLEQEEIDRIEISIEKVDKEIDELKQKLENLVKQEAINGS